MSNYCLIPTTKNKEAIIDKGDYPRISLLKWQLITSKNKKRFYAKTSFWISGKTKNVKLHRYILNLKERYPLVDHINGNGLDCRKSNLRLATWSQNIQNSRKPNKNGYKGIYFCSKGNKKWVARIKFKNQTIRKSFKTKLEAAKAYDSFAKKYFGKFANINFPIMV